MRGGGEELRDYYGKFYFETYDIEPYRADNPSWRAFFATIADAIVAELAPRTVLDVGCGIALLVEALRDRGVEAWGTDVSEYAISQAPESVRPYCSVASITEELDRSYDVIICIEVVEHLPQHLAHRAIENLAAHSKSIIFSSSPSDFRDPSHQNVQPSEYWVGLFARHGFYRDLSFDASFVSHHAVRFHRRRDSPIAVIREYERALSRLLDQIRQMREVNLAASADRARLTTEVEELKRELERVHQQHA
jgi:SAM-dependent methyltransferase